MRDMHVVDSRRDGQTTCDSLRNRKFFKGAQQIRAALVQEFCGMTDVVNQEEKSG